MDERNAQIFGCFVGILITLVITQILFWLVSVSLLAEYVIIIGCAVVFGTLGVVIARRLTKPGFPRETPPPPPARPGPKVPPRPSAP
jgi:uncharacterized membrane protein SpoIIM required for sporulation